MSLCVIFPPVMDTRICRSKTERWLRKSISATLSEDGMLIILPIHCLQLNDHRVLGLEKQNPNNNNVIMAELLFHINILVYL